MKEKEYVQLRKQEKEAMRKRNIGQASLTHKELMQMLELGLSSKTTSIGSFRAGPPYDFYPKTSSEGVLFKPKEPEKRKDLKTLPRSEANRLKQEYNAQDRKKRMSKPRKTEAECATRKEWNELKTFYMHDDLFIAKCNAQSMKDKAKAQHVSFKSSGA